MNEDWWNYHLDHHLLYQVDYKWFQGVIRGVRAERRRAEEILKGGHRAAITMEGNGCTRRVLVQRTVPGEYWFASVSEWDSKAGRVSLATPSGLGAYYGAMETTPYLRGGRNFERVWEVLIYDSDARGEGMSEGMTVEKTDTRFMLDGHPIVSHGETWDGPALRGRPGYAQGPTPLLDEVLKKEVRPYVDRRLPPDTPADRARRRRGQASMDRFLRQWHGGNNPF
jgi:hypothetical protein